MMLRGSFMWKLEPSGKVINLEVESGNGIVLVMNGGHRVGLLERHHLILRKVIKLSSSSLKGSPRGPLW